MDTEASNQWFCGIEWVATGGVQAHAKPSTKSPVCNESGTTVDEENIFGRHRFVVLSIQHTKRVLGGFMVPSKILLDASKLHPCLYSTDDH
jgi:hypothetical protein